ncbi:MAG: phasin family protein [Pseudomonadota bacterium]
MTQKSTTQPNQATEVQALAEWSQAYMETAAALSAAWYDFVGERCHAYAHVIDDVSHCHDLNEAWKAQASFGKETFKAYRNQAAKVSDLMMQVANGSGGKTKH